MKIHLHEKVESAFNFLLQEAKENQENITQYREKIAKLRQQIQEEIGVIDQHQAVSSMNDNAALIATRDKAINSDCHELKQQITDIAAYIQNQQTAEAINLIEPMRARFSLLKIRVDYIDQLERLLQSYEEGITISQKLKRVAEALNLENGVEETSPPPTAPDDHIQPTLH